MGKKAKKKARALPKTPSRLQKDGPADEAVPDPVCAPIEKRPCPHLDKGLSLTALSEKLGSSGTITCEDCREGAADRRGGKGKGKHGKKRVSSGTSSESRAIWVCLECGHYGCGGVGFPTIPQSHAVRHARLTRHQLAIHLENPKLRWCFPCSVPISVDRAEDSEKYKDLFAEAVKLIKGRSAKSSNADVEDTWFGGGSVTGEVIQKAEGADSGSLDRQSNDAYVVRGLVNLGNTCFFNSVVQNLLAMDRLRDHFLTSDMSSVGPVAISLKKLFSEIKSDAGTRNVINPRSLFGSISSKAPQFKGYQQHDSHELLRCLLDLLSTEESDMRKRENSCGDKKCLTFIDFVFGGQISSTVCCTECGHSSTVYEPFLDLSLPVPTKKPPAKKSQPVSRGKTAKVLPKRGGKARAKVSRDASLSLAVNKPRTTSEHLEASGSSSVQNSATAKDDGDIKDNEDGGSGPLVLAEKAAADMEDSLAWLDYIGSSEPLSDEMNSVPRDNTSIVDEKGQSADMEDSFAWLGYIGSSEPLSDEMNSVPQDNSNIVDEKGQFLHESTCMYDLCPTTVTYDSGSASVNNSDVKSRDRGAEDDCLKERSDSRNSWEDEEPLLRIQDSEVLLLPYREENTQAPVISSGEGQVETSLVGSGSGQDESTEFDGFGDLFAEPESASGDTGDSALGVGTSSVAGNSSESDPGEVDDSNSPVSVESCLTHFTKPELLSNDNAWHCEKCSKTLLLQKMNKTKKNKAKKEICDKGNEDIRVDHIIPNEISCNGDTNGDLSGCAKLEQSDNSAESDCKGESEDETTKANSAASLSEQTGKTHLGKGLEDDLLENESEVVEEDGEEKPVPSVKVKRDATKRVLIFKAPPILTVHLKRFSQDVRGRLSKLSGHVKFREFVDLRPYIDSRGKGEEKSVYRLVGVVEHLGTMRGGHYVAYVRGRGSVWYHASDAYVREVSLEEVLRSDAYILFYELI